MVNPYYQDNYATIYNCDCKDILSELPKVDLVLTDPPYGIFKNENSDGVMFGKKTIYSNDNTAINWDKKPSNELFELILSKSDKYIIWGGNYFADVLGSCKGLLIWNKMTGNNVYADGECAFSNVTGTLRIFNHQWCGAFKDSERGKKAMHPTQKPIALMTWCLDFEKDFKIMLDPFMGSGTTLRAAKDLQKKAIGIEIEERYCEIAAERLRQEILNL